MSLPTEAEWAAAVRHSIENPTHTLVPDWDVDGSCHVYCMGAGEPYDGRNCDYATDRTDAKD